MFQDDQEVLETPFFKLIKIIALNVNIESIAIYSQYAIESAVLSTMLKQLIW